MHKAERRTEGSENRHQTLREGTETEAKHDGKVKKDEETRNEIKAERGKENIEYPPK